MSLWLLWLLCLLWLLSLWLHGRGSHVAPLPGSEPWPTPWPVLAGLL